MSSFDVGQGGVDSRPGSRGGLEVYGTRDDGEDFESEGRSQGC